MIKIFYSLSGLKYDLKDNMVKQFISLGCFVYFSLFVIIYIINTNINPHGFNREDNNSFYFKILILFS